MEKDKKKNVAVETYAEDMAKAIADDRSGMIKKIIHGEEEHEKEKKNLSPESIKNRIFMMVGFLFIGLSLATLFFFFISREASTVPVEKQNTPPIFIDSSTGVEVASLNKEKIAQVVRNAVLGTEVKEGKVEGIFLIYNKRDVGLREFITLIKGNFVAGENPPFVNDNFMMGVANTGTKPASAEASVGKDFFMLLKARSLADIFPVMRAWENKMLSDLAGFFGISLSAETKYLFSANFEDEIVQNKNARVLYDKDRKKVIMYIFADDSSVIIADSENAVREIMLRLAASQIKK